MKQFTRLGIALVTAALSLIVFTGCETTGTSSSNPATGAATVGNASSGRLVINRSANMGSGLFLNVSVDGKRVGSVSPGQSYTGSISPGAHVVSVILNPNEMGLTPTKKSIAVQKGQTYTFTATWNGNVLGLE
jgi:hypothetical protein